MSRLRRAPRALGGRVPRVLGARLLRALAALLVCGAVLGGCAEPAPVLDAAGMSRDDAERIPLREQYALAAERYAAFNEFVAEVQRGMPTGAWLDGPGTTEYLPGDGRALGGELPGALADESYYFTVTRWLVSEQDAEAVLAETRRAWEDAGWDVAPQAPDEAGIARAQATVPGRAWISATDDRYGIMLIAFSPVYWGDRWGLATELLMRREAGHTSGGEDPLGGDGHDWKEFAPGAYRPFPEW